MREHRNSLLRIMRALESNGWRIYGYKPDKSDIMTDYYDPARWDGIATKGDLVAVVDARHELGRAIYKTTEADLGPCATCEGTGVDPSGWTLAAARQDPHRYHRETTPAGCVTLLRDVVSPIPFRDDGRLKCRADHCRDGRVMRYTTDVAYHYPTAPIPDGKAKWWVARGNEILAKGVQLSDPESVARKILRAAEAVAT